MLVRPIVKFLLFVAVFPLTSCSGVDVLNATVPDSGYTLVEDIDYGPDPRQKLDLYLPTQPTDDSQVIVFVYGGAWRMGEKSDYEFIGQALSSAGHTVIVPDYRLYPEVVFPDFVTDIVLAIESVESASDSNDSVPTIDTSNVVLMGHSSGAHSVALIAADPRYLADTDTSVKALIGLAGPYDLPIELEEVAPVFASATDPDLTNPLKLATDTHPQTLLIHGTDDERVEPRHTRRYFDVLQSLDVDSRMLMVDGASHASVIAVVADPLQSTSEVAPAILAFLDEI
ncbi:alpha/beta hydrolase [bacterium]|nr:alpha/beta hydrolase [bacterium]